MSKDNEDQSMEEILQSIKRIIADEDEAEVEAPVEEAAADEPEVAEEPATEPEPEKEEEVLELTEIVEEGNVPEVDEDIELIAEDKEPEPEPEPAPAPAAASPLDSLLSDESASAASAALKSLPSKPVSSGGGLGFRSGTTVEDLVVEAMKPMLKEWLDTNLPELVERLVEKEIKKLSN